MFSRGGSVRGVRGNFLQACKNKMPAPPMMMTSFAPPCTPEDVVSNQLDLTALNISSPANKAKKVPVVLVERYKRGETHAVSMLYELAREMPFQLELKETMTPENISGLHFAFRAVIDGQAYKIGIGRSKKDAKLRAAELALEDLLENLENDSLVIKASDGPPPLPVKEKESTSSDFHPGRAIYEHKNPIWEQILEAVKVHLNSMMKTHPEFSAYLNTAAAFVIQTSSGCELVAMGTGIYTTNEKETSNGRLLHDSNAAVTARRSLMRCLYRNLFLFYSKIPHLKEKSIFVQDPSSKLLRLRADITVHLYLNRMPEGAILVSSNMQLNPRSMSAWEVNSQMGLHVAVDGQVFTVFSSLVDLSGPKLLSLSVADKLSQWQVLGFQGALLSHFIEPIYISSILIGDASCSQVRGMEVAINQRVDGLTPRLPMHYCTYRPQISSVPRVVVANTTSSDVKRSFSLNWSQGDISLELVDGLEGKTVNESPFKSSSALASRLCKAAMLSRFNQAAKESQREDLLTTYFYRKAKMMAKPYQEAKAVLKSYLLQQGYGSWPLKSLSDHFNM